MSQPARNRLGRRPALLGVDVLDVVLPIAVFAASVPVLVDRHDGCGCRPTPWWGYALLVAECVLLLPRRRFPLTAGLLVGALTALYGATTLPDPALPFAGLVGLYSAAAYARPRRAMVAAGIAVVGIVLSLGLDSRSTAQDWSIIGLVFATAWLLGYAARSRRDVTLALEQRADSLERSRTAEAERAVAAERARIAREMHDVVAHAVSLMVIQAEAGPVVLESDPARAAAAFDTISSTGKQALAEMRRVLGVLREGQQRQLAPQPGVEQLDELIESFRGAGLRVRADLGPARSGATDAVVGLAVYRIVQESLTNALKHAAAADVTVDVRCTDGQWQVTVTDNGPGGAVAGNGTSGNGIAGMRERAGLLGGSLAAGPARDGGWQVRATFPADPVPAR
jgi:signal transduction histidine kinase